MTLHVRRPLSGDPEEGWPTDWSHTAGHAESGGYPWDWDEDHAEELSKELHAQLARKRPPGFAPWPDKET